MTPMATTTWQVAASTVTLLPVAVIVDQPRTLAMPGLETWGAILGIAVLSTALGYILYFRILASAGATNLLLVTFLIPVSAIILGSLVLGETLATKHFTGMALIGLGLICIDGRSWRASAPYDAACDLAVTTARRGRRGNGGWGRGRGPWPAARRNGRAVR